MDAHYLVCKKLLED